MIDLTCCCKTCKNWITISKADEEEKTYEILVHRHKDNHTTSIILSEEQIISMANGLREMVEE